jgi:predicted ATPase/DNA-binding CsgD family transcriptional regulator
MSNSNFSFILEPLTEREIDILRLMAEGLSNPEIADQLVIGLETVRWYTKQIYSKLGVHSRTQASIRARDLGLLEGDAALTSAPPAQPAPLWDLPTYSTSFVGQEDKLAELARLLNDPNVRLITVAGPGGMGKTRLCVEVVQRYDFGFEDGVYFVPLLSARSVDDVILAIASALNLRLPEEQEPADELLRYLADKRLLLILDNFEQVLHSVDLVGAILDPAPQVKLMVTSQASLNLREEWVRFIDSLTYPDDGEDLSDPYAYSAVQLFDNCVRRVRGDFTLADHLDSVAQICRLVRGVPLGIELAAAWVKTLTCEDVAAQIQRNMDFLATNQRDIEERHRSMQAVFDYAWNLLTKDEQSVFRRLSVFRGGFGLAAAEQVAGASIQTLSELVSKSLLMQNAAGLYEIHGLLRQYGERKLENIDMNALSVRSGKLLGWVSFLKGSFDHLQSVAEGILDFTSDGSSINEKGFALAALGVLAGTEGDFSRCKQLCEAGMAVIENDPIGSIFAHFGLAIAYCSLEDYATTKRHIRLALTMANELRNPAFSVLCLPMSALVVAHEAEPERAVELMGLAFSHPSAKLGWMAKLPLIVQLRTDLQAELGTAAYEDAWTRGKHLNLDAVMAQLLTS